MVSLNGDIVTAKKVGKTTITVYSKEDNITNKLIKNMLNCLKELEKKYPKNIEIIDKEE